MTSPPTTYLFDLDGTLIDSIDLILTTYRFTVEKHLGHAPPDDAWLRGLGTPLRRQLAEFARGPEQLEEMVRTYREFNNQNHDRLVKEYPGARTVVRTLEQRGHKLGIVTSKSRAGAQRGLQACGLDGYFGARVAVEDVEKHKPHPEPVLKALKLVAAQPQEAVFIGDSPHDMAAGRKAAVRTGAALWGPFKRSMLEEQSPDLFLERPEDILSIGRK